MGQLLTTVDPHPVVASLLTMPAWVGFGPERMWCKYKLRKLNSVFSTAPSNEAAWKLGGLAMSKLDREQPTVLNLCPVEGGGCRG